MKRILILISIMFLAGCVTTKFNEEKANAYLLSHPDRPDQIKEAISVGEVVQGMNEEEVTICMGEPDVITTSQSYQLNTTHITWAYFNRAKLKRTFIFFKDGAVAGINVSTQKGIIISPYPGGPINFGPVLRPVNPNVIVQPRRVIISPPLLRRTVRNNNGRQVGFKLNPLSGIAKKYMVTQ